MAPPRSCALVSTALILSVFAIPASAARLSTDTCTSSNYDYDLLSDPADTWYYRGSGGDSFCTANPQLGSYLCGVNGVKPCSITKTETCQDATYPIDCAAAPRVFSVNLDSNCDYVVTCEYLDSGSSTPSSTSAPTSTGGSTIPGGTLPIGTIPVATTPVAAPLATVPSLPTKSPVVTIGPGTVPSPTTSTVLPAVVPNLLPKPTDVVLTSAYAIGVASYSCNKGASFNNVSITANLYSNGAGQALAGSYVSANGSQVFSLAQGTAQVVAVGGTYATPSNFLTDGGYGSLNQTYYTASGTLSLATVTYITQTVPSGGILPRNATCALTPIANVTLPPWQVPFQANFTFYSTYTPPV